MRKDLDERIDEGVQRWFGHVKRMERDRGTEGKPSTPSRATDAHIGDEERNGNRKREKRKEQGAGL